MSEFSSINPATGETVWRGKSAGIKEVDQAVSSAKQALAAWSLSDLTFRIQYLEAFAQRLKDRHMDLSEIISKETGKPLWESKLEINSIIAKVALSIEAYYQRAGLQEKTLGNVNYYTRHKPHGVIAVFGPFNFPGHLPMGHIIPALLAGNTVIFKPSEMAPLVAESLYECWIDTGIPQGVINVLQGGRVTGTLLSEHGGINGIFFTGSWKTGCHFSKMFAEDTGKILALEMGGNNPLIVSKIQDVNAAVYVTIQSAFLTAGQRCSCARRLIVIDGPHKKTFLEKLQEAIRGIKVGAYNTHPEPFMGPVISQAAAEKILSSQESLQLMGGKSLIECRLLIPNTGFLSPGLINTTSIRIKPDEEIFGPLLQIIEVNSLDEAIDEGNHTAYGLTAGLLSDSQEEYKLFYSKIKAGIINWNTPTTGASSAAPFGGLGHSGNHRPSAYYAVDYCCYPVASAEIATLEKPSNLPPGMPSLD